MYEKWIYPLYAYIFKKLFYADFKKKIMFLKIL